MCAGHCGLLNGNISPITRGSHSHPQAASQHVVGNSALSASSNCSELSEVIRSTKRRYQRSGVAFTGTQTFVFGIMTLSVRQHRCLLRQQIECRVPLYHLPLNTCFCTSLFKLSALAVCVCLRVSRLSNNQVFWQAIAQARGRVIGNTAKQWIIPEAYPIFAVIGAGATLFSPPFFL